MAHLDSVTATQYTKVAISRVPLGNTDTLKDWFDRFRAGSLVNTHDHPVIYLESMRDIPQVGTPANIVKVPVYGEDQSFSIGAQPDAPDLEFTLNMEPNKWAAGTSSTNTLASHEASIRRMAGDGRVYGMAFYFLNSKVERPVTRPGNGAASSFRLGAGPIELKYDSVGQKSNSIIFFRGRVESALWNPMRDDSSTVTVTLSITSPQFYGLFTMDGTAPFGLMGKPPTLEMAAGSLDLVINKYINGYDDVGGSPTLETALAGYKFKASVAPQGRSGVISAFAPSVPTAYVSGTAAKFTATRAAAGSTVVRLEAFPKTGPTTIDTRLGYVDIPVNMS